MLGIPDLDRIDCAGLIRDGIGFSCLVILSRSCVLGALRDTFGFPLDEIGQSHPFAGARTFRIL